MMTMPLFADVTLLSLSRLTPSYSKREEKIPIPMRHEFVHHFPPGRFPTAHRGPGAKERIHLIDKDDTGRDFSRQGEDGLDILLSLA